MKSIIIAFFLICCNGCLVGTLTDYFPNKDKHLFAYDPQKKYQLKQDIFLLVKRDKVMYTYGNLYSEADILQENGSGILNENIILNSDDYNNFCNNNRIEFKYIKLKAGTEFKVSRVRRLSLYLTILPFVDLLPDARFIFYYGEIINGNFAGLEFEIDIISHVEVDKYRGFIFNEPTSYPDHEMVEELVDDNQVILKLNSLEEIENYEIFDPIILFMLK